MEAPQFAETEVKERVSRAHLLLLLGLRVVSVDCGAG